MLALNGRVFIAQRFAIDWVQLKTDGATFTGDPKDNKNYKASGKLRQLHRIAPALSDHG
jgi:hypothetical protein